MKTVDAAGEIVSTDMIRKAIVGTGLLPEVAEMSPAQRCALESLGLQVKQVVSSKNICDVSDQIPRGTFRIAGIRIETRIDCPNNVIRIRDGEGKTIGEIFNLAIPIGYES